MTKIRYLLVILVSWIITAFWLLSIHQLRKKNDSQMQICQLPPFKFTCINNRSITHNDVYTFNKVTILIYFDSQCENCVREIENIKNRLGEFNNIHLVFVSSAQLENIKTFFEKKQILNNTNITICSCTYLKLHEWFGNLASPTIFIYSKKGKLLKKFTGTTRIDDMLNYCQE